MRTSSLRTDFLLRNGWVPVKWRATLDSPAITMWRDPLRPEREMWPHEAERVADRRFEAVRRVMED